MIGVELGKPEEAFPLADKGAMRYSEDWHLLDTRGVIFYRLLKYTEARRDLERCLSLSNQPTPDRARTYFHLARVDFKENRVEEMRKHLRQALTLETAQAVFTTEERQEIQAGLE